MQFFKVLGLLTLLVAGNLEFAFAHYEQGSYEEALTSDFQYVEDLQDLGESTLTGPSSTLVFNLSQDYGIQDFKFRSFNIAVQAKTYIYFSAFIVPALNLQEIIFPFHTFL
ncbi:hypothetical protein BH23BAC2_BH23BAC2_06610 [soil metagenome]